MTVFPFKPPRIQTSLQTLLQLQECGSDHPLPPQTEATIINFSTEGACLVVAHLLLENRHIFYETLNSDSYHLLLRSVEPAAPKKTFTLAARSVWMDATTHDNTPAFKIGVAFLQQQKELFRMIRHGEL